MTQTAGLQTAAHTGYRHEAFLCRGIDEFLAGTVPFIRDGVRAGEPVMVAVIEPRLERIRSALGADAERVLFVDMVELGHNPARIIPGWQEFVDEYAADGRPVRGVGEPIWAGRRPAELIECQLHEALLNVAVSPDTPLWLRCPYDVAALDPSVVREAHRSHPITVDERAYRGSTVYGGANHVDEIFADELAEPSGYTEDLLFGPDDLALTRSTVIRQAIGTGMCWRRVEELGLTMHELATNSLRHGGGRGMLRVWREPGALVCEIRDAGQMGDPMVGRRKPAPSAEGGRGLWMANQLCDLVQIRSGARGTVVRVSTWL